MSLQVGKKVKKVLGEVYINVHKEEEKRKRKKHKTCVRHVTYGPESFEGRKRELKLRVEKKNPTTNRSRVSAFI